MLFNSYAFLFGFLPLTLLGFFLIGGRNRQLGAAWLVLASLFFYGWWDVRFVALLLASIAVNFSAARALYALRSAGRRRETMIALGLAVAANLLLLGYFKYFNFFLMSANAALGSHFVLSAIILPLGISFFTFTQIAFLVDTVRGEVRAFNLVHYALFVTYFPHLIAGPILHHREMMPQFAAASTYRPRAENVTAGLAFLALGLAKKCLLADRFAPDVAAVFQAAHAGTAIGAVAAWHGALAFTLQLYFDFSGYCDMAVGLSRLLGIRLPYNFDSPYRAAGIIDFWRRWHMTLSRFLRDYLYFPLGGNRRGRKRRYLNLLVTMLLGGLWHGANWTFVAWGGLHGLYLAINHVWRAVRPKRLLDPLPLRLRRTVSVALTFTAVVVAWVFFRAPDFATATRLLTAMAGTNGLGSDLPQMTQSGMLLDPLGASGWRGAIYFGRYAVALAIVFALPNTQQIIDRAFTGGTVPKLSRLVGFRPGYGWGAVLGVLAAAAILTFTQVSEFLYFQF